MHCPNEDRHSILEFCADCGYSRARQEDEEYAAEHAAEDTSGD